MDEVILILCEMEQLLRSCSAFDYANTLEETIRLCRADPPAACSTICGSPFWGGSGSFFDLQIDPANHHVSSDYRRDNARYAAVMLHLLHVLISLGCMKRADLPPIERNLLYRSQDVSEMDL
jgi:hypothetical protein